MRLFGKVDGVINRFDRAGWLTMPFDLDLRPRVYEVIGGVAYIYRSLSESIYIERFTSSEVER